MSRIAGIRARQVLDSRGNPALEADVFLEDGSHGRGMVPAGASKGKGEACELRDKDAAKYGGMGVLEAAAHVEQVIAPEVNGMDARDQEGVDDKLIALDGTDNKRHLGANALLAVSLGAARAASVSAGLPLYRYLGGLSAIELPVPMVNILSGGLHGGGNADFQDYLVIPLRATSYSDALRDAAAIYAAMKDVLKSHAVYTPGVADEGGYAPKLDSNAAGFDLMIEAFERAGFRPGKDAAIAVDVAASQFASRGRYDLAAEGVTLDSRELARRLEEWAGRYPILSIEDGLGEDDWAGWKDLTKKLGGRCQLIGDDLFVTNLERLKRGIDEGAANSVLVKMNQAGTLSETLAVAMCARSHGYGTVVSARSGETEDDFMSDLAVALGAGQIKIGSVTRSERLAKYNRLLRIESELGARAAYAGADPFRNYLP
ncbi:MAG: phosphopyruvate hydratase [Acidobacteriota bacterium]|nr:phosphopyruvate hydratase [Acidobacteriota bacterium]